MQSKIISTDKSPINKNTIKVPASPTETTPIVSRVTPLNGISSTTRTLAVLTDNTKPMDNTSNNYNINNMNYANSSRTFYFILFLEEYKISHHKDINNKQVVSSFPAIEKNAIQKSSDLLLSPNKADCLTTDRYGQDVVKDRSHPRNHHHADDILCTEVPFGTPMMFRPLLSRNKSISLLEYDAGKQKLVKSPVKSQGYDSAYIPPTEGLGLLQSYPSHRISTASATEYTSTIRMSSLHDAQLHSPRIVSIGDIFDNSYVHPIDNTTTSACDKSTPSNSANGGDGDDGDGGGDDSSKSSITNQSNGDGNRDSSNIDSHVKLIINKEVSSPHSSILLLDNDGASISLHEEDYILSPDASIELSSTRQAVSKISKE